MELESLGTRWGFGLDLCISYALIVCKILVGGRRVEAMTKREI